MCFVLHSNEFSIWECNIWKSGLVCLPVRNQGMCFIKRSHCTKVRWAELWRGFHQRHDYVLVPIQKSLSSRDEKKNPYTDRLRNIWSSEGNRTNISKLQKCFFFSNESTSATWTLFYEGYLPSFPIEIAAKTDFT